MCCDGEKKPPQINLERHKGKLFSNGIWLVAKHLASPPTTPGPKHSNSNGLGTGKDICAVWWRIHPSGSHHIFRAVSVSHIFPNASCVSKPNSAAAWGASLQVVGHYPEVSHVCRMGPCGPHETQIKPQTFEARVFAIAVCFD